MVDDNTADGNEYVHTITELVKVETLSDAEGQSGQLTGLHKELQVMVLANMSTENSQDPVGGDDRSTAQEISRRTSAEHDPEVDKMKHIADKQKYSSNKDNGSA